MNHRFHSLLACLLAWALPAAVAGCRGKPAGASVESPPAIEVVEEATGRPLPAIELEVLDGSKLIASGTTDGSGRLRLPREIHDFVHARFRDPAGAHVSDEVELDLAAGRCLSVARAVKVTLPVTDADGAPITRWTATAWTPRGRPRVLEGSADGPIGPLAEGPVKLVVAAPGRESAVIDAKLKPDRATGLAALRPVRLRAGGGRLAGRLQPAPPHGRIEAVLRYAGAGQIAAVDGSGAFELEGFPVRAEMRAILVLREGSHELYAREVDLGRASIDAGVISLEE